MAISLFAINLYTSKVFFFAIQNGKTKKQFKNLYSKNIPERSQISPLRKIFCNPQCWRSSYILCCDSRGSLEIRQDAWLTHFFIPSSFEDFKTIKFCKFALSLRDFKIRFFFNYCSTIIRSENMRQICFGVWDRSKTPLYKLSKSNYLFVLRYFGLRKVSSECMCGINSTWGQKFASLDSVILEDM